MNLIPIAHAASDTANESASVFPGWIVNIFVGIIIFIIGVVISVLLKNWIQRVIRRKQGDRHKEVVILFGRIVFTISFVTTTLIALNVAGAPLDWFSGGLGLGLAFALREILASFFAGIILLTNSKFNIGDFVTLDSGQAGTIVDIQSRTTSLRAVDGGEITVPNLAMLNAKVVCYTKNPVRRHNVQIGVGYGTNLKEAAALIEKTIKSNEHVEPEPGPVVIVSEVADSAVVFEARFWTESKTKWWLIKSEITRDVFDALMQAGIDIPYPVQTLRVDKDSSDLLAKNSSLIDLPKQDIALNKKNIFTERPVEAPEAAPVS